VVSSKVMWSDRPSTSKETGNW